MLTTYHLHGVLGQMFGKTWTVDVQTVAEGFRAIDINLKGKLFSYWSQEGRDEKYRVKLGDYAVEDEMELRAPSSKDVHIVPVVAGSASAAGKIIAGIIMIVLTVVTFGGFAAVAASMWGMMFVTMGASLVLGGIVQALTPVPNFNSNAGNDGDQSKTFQGNAMSIAQGGSVPIVYGRMMVTPMPISVSLSNTSSAITRNGSYGGVGQTILEGGGSQYYPIGSVRDDYNDIIMGGIGGS